MTVIPLARDTDPAGVEIEAAIAAHCGIEYVDHKMLLELVAGCARQDVRITACLTRDRASLFDRWSISRHRILRFMASQIAQLAAKKIQVMDDGLATVLLRPVHHVICIVIRPSAARLSDLARQPDRATNADAGSTPGVRCAMHGDCESVFGRYDMAMDTDKQSVDRRAKATTRLAQGPGSRPTEKLLETFARIMQDAECALSQTWTGSCVQVGQQTIGLSGVTSREHAIARIERHLHGSRSAPSQSRLPPAGPFGW
jgi:hypothetical protein